MTEEVLRGFILYYADLVRDELEHIEGLKKFNIHNDEMEMHYENLMEFIIRANFKVEEYLNFKE